VPGDLCSEEAERKTGEAKEGIEAIAAPWTAP
jgi:hypothetical protein